MKIFKKLLIKTENGWIDFTNFVSKVQFANYADAEENVLALMDYFNGYDEYANLRFEYYMFILGEVK